jgi:hypothetical protein
LEASSETGSAAKTQGRAQEKPLTQRISLCFADDIDGAIKARAGRKSRLKEPRKLLSAAAGRNRLSVTF